MHGICYDGQTLKCKYGGYCQCFFRISVGMHRNSGVYKIKFEIKKINNERLGNMIDITHETNNSQSKRNYWFASHDYIGWSSCNNTVTAQNHKNAPNGLLCGYTNKYQNNNIFVLSHFKYIHYKLKFSMWCS